MLSEKPGFGWLFGGGMLVGYAGPRLRTRTSGALKLYEERAA
jgi:hypothetical protein